MNGVIFLQNAWSPVYAGREWPRRSWLVALARSRSGQRLRYLTDDLTCCENTTPVCGSTPDSVVPADSNHIRKVLLDRKPEVVICCGRQAEEALKPIYSGPLIAVPHPAHRLLTNELFVKAAAMLIPGFEGRLALRQKQNSIEIEPL